MLSEHLAKLNDIIDPEVLAEAEARQRAAVLYEPVDRLPTLVNCPVPGWPAFCYREGFYDMEKMLASELAGAWVGAHVGDDRMYTIRANYGVGTVASMFGCEIVLTNDNAMPWCMHLSDERLDRVLESSEVDIEAGLGKRVAETVNYYKDMLSRYDKLARCVRIFVCDTQGPFDVAHLVMGSKIYTEIYDNPTRVHRLLELTADTCIRVNRAQKELIGEGCDWSWHSQMLIRGGVRICEDTPTNLSAEFYAEFPKRHNERVLRELGGGWIHYCGNGKQILPEVLSTPGVNGINFGNPEMQDIAAIYHAAAPLKIPVLLWGLLAPLPDEITTGIILMTGAKDLESARAIVNQC
jgi:hypothetical protein